MAKARTAPLQTFFTDRLARQQGASSHTIASYRDSLRLLMVFTAERTHVSPSELQIENLDPPLVAAFLDHLEHRLPVRGGASA